MQCAFVLDDNVVRDGREVSGRLELFPGLGLPPGQGVHPLHFVDVDDVLVGRAALDEGVQLVHLPDVLPQVDQVRGDVEPVQEEPSRHPDVLELRHQLAVEAAQRVTSQESSA